ncbi:MAG: hypothetical protein K8J31_31450 [Anaerolineae bacterium]|nr:hypothetical protein [Anaerolineae bacterium]
MTNPPSRTMQVGLAFVAGIGLTLMIVVAGIAVVSGETVDSSALNILFLLGVAMLVTGLAAWFGVVRPDTHFDDINVPMYHGHDHHDAHEAHTEGEKALAEHH